jgi:hypothetical protein
MVADVQIVQGGQFHDEIVRVLAIHDRFSERGPADSVPGKDRCVVVAGSRLNITVAVSIPGPNCRCAVGMNQFVEKTLSAPRGQVSESLT